MCFALSALTNARGATSRVARTLETNQASWFRAAEQILGDPAKLRARLGVGDPSTWPPPLELDELLRPLAIDDTRIVLLPTQPESDGSPVATGAFRIRRTNAWPTAFFGLFVGSLASLTVIFAGLPELIIPVILVCALSGLWI